MRTRGEFGWNLPNFELTIQRARGDQGKTPTGPMPSTNVHQNWTGKTKDQVIAKPDMIPEEVRRNPRPYLQIPARYSAQAKADKRTKKEEYVAAAVAAAAANPAPGAAPTPTPNVSAPSSSELRRFDISMPLAPPIMGESHGAPKFAYIDFTAGKVMYKYASGGKWEEDFPQQSNTHSTMPTVVSSIKRSAIDEEPEAEAESGSVTMPFTGTNTKMPHHPPRSTRNEPKRVKQVRPETRVQAQTDEDMVDEHADYTGSLEDHAAIMNDAEDDIREDSD